MSFPIRVYRGLLDQRREDTGDLKDAIACAIVEGTISRTHFRRLIELMPNETERLADAVEDLDSEDIAKFIILIAKGDEDDPDNYLERMPDGTKK